MIDLLLQFFFSSENLLLQLKYFVYNIICMPLVNNGWLRTVLVKVRTQVLSINDWGALS